MATVRRDTSGGLLARCPNGLLTYWSHPQATASTVESA